MKMQKNKPSVTRPLLRYHGGKFLLAPWITSFFPDHRTYIEPFGGAGSVLILKERSFAEVYNDLDGEVVNLFRCVRDCGQELVSALHLTPFSREEFEQSYLPAQNPLEQARRTVVRSFLGFGSVGASGAKTGFRAAGFRSHSTAQNDWKNYPECLSAIVERLRGVVIENRHYSEVMRQQDRPDTLHYLDPPYVLATRHKGNSTKVYRFEMQEHEHVEMCRTASEMAGYCIISGYDNEIYNDALRQWHKVTRKALADGGADRTEVLWISPQTWERLKRQPPQASLHF